VRVYGDRQHGRHGLKTETAMCPGSEVLPHGWRTSRTGSFGWWNDCLCGSSFSDYYPDDPTTPWNLHKAEHGIEIPSTR